MAQAARRFWRDATAAQGDNGWRVLLDSQPLHTPAKRNMVLPDASLADAVAAEWDACGANIDPAAMPFTRLANSAIDGVADRRDEVVADIVRYAGTDLMCYRADQPAALVAAQSAAWDEPLAWAASRFDIALKVTTGVTHVAQSPAALARVAAALASLGSFALTGAHVATTLTGSAVLALALRERRLTPDAGWAVAHVDENFQAATWGMDAEAVARRESRRIAYNTAARFLSL